MIFDVPANFVFFVVLLIIFTIKLHVAKLKSCLEVEEIWPIKVVFVFCVLESKLKKVPLKLQNDHCEWIFQLDWLSQSWRYVFQSMARNSGKTHHAKASASCKDSVKEKESSWIPRKGLKRVNNKKFTTFSLRKNIQLKVDRRSSRDKGK